jgi:hypothetical protein
MEAVITRLSGLIYAALMAKRGGLVVGAITKGLASGNKRCDQRLTIVQVVGALWVLTLKASNQRAFKSRLNGAELRLGLLMKTSTSILR